MRTAYRVLAYLVAFGVVVQAAAIAYAIFGLGAWIEGGGVLDKAALESESSDFAGSGGFALHGIDGQMVIPVIAIILFVVSFFAKVPRGVAWAGGVLGAVVVQVLLGMAGDGLPQLGILHGAFALVLLVVAILAGRQASVSGATTADEPARVV